MEIQDPRDTRCTSAWHALFGTVPASTSEQTAAAATMTAMMRAAVNTIGNGRRVPWSSSGSAALVMGTRASTPNKGSPSKPHKPADLRIHLRVYTIWITFFDVERKSPRCSYPTNASNPYCRRHAVLAPAVVMRKGYAPDVGDKHDDTAGQESRSGVHGRRTLYARPFQERGSEISGQLTLFCCHLTLTASK